MNTYLTVALCMFAVVASDGVTVKVGDFSFPLESVKQLKNLLEEVPQNPRLVFSIDHVCANPQLPKDFQPLCSSPKASDLVPELEAIARESAICEICANVACSGC